jgi:hypothetical protein
MSTSLGTCRAAYRSASATTERYSPFPFAVWDYQVAGIRVIRHWFRYRTGEPTDRYPTELDAIPLGRWDDLMIKELHNLLNVLGFLVELAPTQQPWWTIFSLASASVLTSWVGSAAIPAPPGAVGPLVSEGPQGLADLPDSTGWFTPRASCPTILHGQFETLVDRRPSGRRQRSGGPG